MKHYTPIPRPTGSGKRDTWSGGAGTATSWQRERARGPILPMRRPSLWARLWGR